MHLSDLPFDHDTKTIILPAALGFHLEPLPASLDPFRLAELIARCMTYHHHARIDWLLATSDDTIPFEIVAEAAQLSLSVPPTSSGPNLCFTLIPIPDFTALPTEVGQTICRA
jgi:hypothetical protein